MLWSHSCGWEDLLVPVSLTPGRRFLMLTEGWQRRWTATWRYAGDKVTCSVDDLAAVPRSGLGPVRGFTWRRDQRHRPGLEYLVSTRRQHGFESLEEDRLLLALDFCGEVVEVLSQPLEMRFQTADKWRKHTPDFLAVTAAGTWLIDVRPERLIKAGDLESFAATQEMVLSCGWRYAVAARWRPRAMTTLDTLAAGRRPTRDLLQLQPTLLARAERGGRFGELAAGPYWPVARAQLLHLLWHRRLGVDLSRPLTDGSWLVAAGGVR